jgi:signal transduction histidine kinase
MQLLKTKPTMAQLQWIIWIFVFLVIALSLMQMDPFEQAVIYAFLNTCFYAAIVYGNISLLYPLYQKGNVFLYIVAVTGLLLAMGALRIVISLHVYNLWFAQQPERLSLKAFYNSVFGGLMVFMLSFVFRIAIAYFTLKQQSEEMIAQRKQAELNLLKSQVQPHFLFNTLNNIYYEAYLEAPRTARLIERLSDIMRYFVDESPKQKVRLATEAQFLENYIALEKIRIRHEIDINFITRYDTNVTVPPMLLMTFVENIFKHGIDKSSSHNKMEISLIQENQRLTFTTTNTLPEQPQNAPSTGFGISNLRQRLELLYGNNFQLETSTVDMLFKASLNIPLL